MRRYALAALALVSLVALTVTVRHSRPGHADFQRSEIHRIQVHLTGAERVLAGRDLASLTPAQKQSVLQPLAYALMQRQQRELAVADALPIIRGPLERAVAELRRIAGEGVNPLDEDLRRR